MNGRMNEMLSVQAPVIQRYSCSMLQVRGNYGNAMSGRSVSFHAVAGKQSDSHTGSVPWPGEAPRRALNWCSPTRPAGAAGHMRSALAQVAWPGLACSQRLHRMGRHLRAPFRRVSE